MSFEADAASWSVVVLTGGASRRMGSDKATLVVDGLTLLERTLSGVPAEVAVVVAGPEVSLPAGVGRQRVRFAVEDPPGGGPVAGLDAALVHVSTAVVVVLATDLPFVGGAPGVLAARLRDAEVDAVLAGDASGRPQQLCAAYRTAALREAIAAGGSPAGASMRSVVARLRVAVADVGGAGAGAAAIGDPTWDVDTPDDVARMTALLRGDDPEEQVD